MLLFHDAAPIKLSPITPLTLPKLLNIVCLLPIAYNLNETLGRKRQSGRAGHVSRHSPET